MMISQQDWIGKWAALRPGNSAIKEYESGKTYTYGELNKIGNRLANYLIEEIKLTKGSRIVIVSENRAEYFHLFSAALKAGLILVPLNHRLTPSELAYLMDTADPELILFDSEHEKKVLEAIVLSGKGDIAALGFEDMQELMHPETASKFDKSFEIHPVDEEDPIFILFTSGTTGFPKGAIYTHGMMFWNSVNTALSLKINSETRTINNMPLFHSGGWNVLATPVLHHGGFFVLTKRFEAKTLLSLIEQEKFTLFMGVPTMLKMIRDEDGFDRTDFSGLDYVIVGGEPMPVPLIEEYAAKGVAIRQGFGMTEVGPNLTSLHQDDAIRKKGSIGKPNFYLDIKIKADGEQAPGAAKRGELLLRGPVVTPGYWRNRQATDEVIQDGWFSTGDIVMQDQEGYLYVVDRIKNMFISGGENVYPAQVERIMMESEAIKEVVVIGVPDEKWGEVGKAFIVLNENVSCSEQDLRAYCSERLAKFKIPKYFEFLKELPKNDTGKLDRKSLMNS